MTPEQFRRAALKLPGAVEAAHHDHPDFRANGRVFASLSPAGQGWAMAKVSPEEQETFVRNEPAAFEPFNGAWGKAGCTRIKLDVAPAAAVEAALLMAWRGAQATKPRATKPRAAKTPSAEKASKAAVERTPAKTVKAAKAAKAAPRAKKGKSG
jgi:hypothetical protein